MEVGCSMAPRQENRVPYDAGRASLKIRRGSSSSTKRIGTPYQRPPSTSRRIVDSASRFLTKSATFLFSSLFKRQAPAISAVPAAAVSNADSEDVPPLEIAQPSNEVELDENDDRRDDIGNTIDNDKNARTASLGATELERILKEKDLTREQCERYICLIKSKTSNSEPQPLALYQNSTQDEPGVEYTNRRKIVSFKTTAVEAPLTGSKSLIAQQSHTVKRAERWTPMQMPISGGRELLKNRAVINEKSPGTNKISPNRSIRGPSILASPVQKRKPSSEVMDLTCFRKPNQSTAGLKIDIPSISGQSTRTAQKILDTLDRRISFKNIDTREKTRVGHTRFTEAPTLATLPPPPGFTYPSDVKHPPNPQEKSSGGSQKTRHVKNGVIPSFMSFTSDGEVYDLDEMAARAEKATAALASSNGKLSGPGSSSRFAVDEDGFNPFPRGDLTATSAKENGEVLVKSEQFILEAQSLAPPEINPSSTGGFERSLKRKKSAKRVK